MKKEEQNQKSESALREEKILAFWKDNNIFQKSVEKNSPKGEFVFYEGPPTANAKPALHHLEARAFKDVIPRYKTMKGYHVRRRAGWDTHGLPVELQIEKKLGLKSKKEIETYGIAEFNKECKESVFNYIADWESFTDRMGYWVDKKDAYFTFDSSYIESLWNIVSEIEKKSLLYKDYKVLPWCPRCGTGLSSHELAQGYEDVKDLSVTAKFKIVGFEGAYFLAWTTTPWTLPGNVGLAVGKDITYVEAKVGNDILVLAKERLSILTEPYEIIAEHLGSEMVGMAYEPLYPFIKDKEVVGIENAWKVYVADFVTTTDGTGIVHTAVMYGQEDFELGTKVGLPKYHLVKEDGTFKEETEFLAGKFVKDEETAVDIIKDLAHRGLLFKKEKYEHSYPHCWRCKTPLIYYARDSWYIRMSSLRDELVRENETINWEPAHTRDGRFGEWLREIKDWAISRERYWGTPLPLWQKADGSIKVIGSIEDLKKSTKKSGNKYFVMRHGLADGNSKGLVHSTPSGKYHLTDIGREQVAKTADEISSEKIDLIFCSDFARVKESAEVMAEKLGINKDSIITDIRLREFFVPSFEGKSWDEYHNFYPKTLENFIAKAPGDESYLDLKQRVLSFLYELETKYKDKKILIVTHGAPAWLMFTGAQGLSTEIILEEIKKAEGFHYFQNAEVREIPFVPIPHNEKFELDLHRPYIDEIELVDEEGNPMKRVKEVMDVWFDSGAMPFAQDHYPFENKELRYPADFISEAIDQTRGWFYTLHAIGILMGKGKAYKNVICLGHILDAQGKKMSKSIGNVLDPWDQMGKYGVDTLRLWMYSVNQPGESKNYDEKTVLELSRKVFSLLDNCYKFYELYKDENINVNPRESTNVLDQWILATLDKTIYDGTKSLDVYDLFTSARLIREFVDEFSTWYIRRSRDRFKGEDVEDRNFALVTTRYVLLEIAKYMAPFTPFYAEDLYKRAGGEKESVHLESWSENESGNMKVLEKMETVRIIVTKGLELRQKAGIKIRQPLKSFSFEAVELEPYHEIIRDELNVKEILSGELALDTVISPELKKEGDYREFVRGVQDLRKQMDLTPNDRISIVVSTDAQELISSFMDEFKKTVQADNVEFAENDGTEIKVDSVIYKATIKK